VIHGNIITIDALGTQTEIAEKIGNKGADYILVVKGNQKQLLEDIVDELRFSKDIETDTHLDLGHGRIETRKSSVISNVGFLENEDNKWKNSSQVIEIKSIIEFKNSDKPNETATR
jgi:predicted transposase YbfD/YdcC